MVPCDSTTGSGMPRGRHAPDEAATAPDCRIPSRNQRLSAAPIFPDFIRIAQHAATNGSGTTERNTDMTPKTHVPPAPHHPALRQRPRR